MKWIPEVPTVRIDPALSILTQSTLISDSKKVLIVVDLDSFFSCYSDES